MTLFQLGYHQGVPINDREPPNNGMQFDSVAQRATLRK
jgi:hypothetical protein